VKEVVITVTEAARNFSDYINRAHYQKTTFVLLKNGKPVARIQPESEKRGTGGDLADALAKIDLPAKEAKRWHRELRTARKGIKMPADKWQ
jgi:prevent-host-death family protein